MRMWRTRPGSIISGPVLAGSKWCYYVEGDAEDRDNWQCPPLGLSDEDKLTYEDGLKAATAELEKRAAQEGWTEIVEA